MGCWDQFSTYILNSWWNSNFGAAIVSGLITGLVLGFTVWWETNKARKSEKAEIKAICQAIKTELESVLAQYNETRMILEGIKDNEPFQNPYRIDQDYFSIYHANTSSIGKLPDPLRTDIVRAYTALKSLVDTFKENNHIIQELNDYVLENKRVTLLNKSTELEEHFQTVFKYYSDNLVSMGQSLKESNTRATGLVSKSLLSLNLFLSSK
jgi:hypothetical protein